MRIHYDKDVDAAYLRLSTKKPSGVIELAEGINIDVTEKGEIVGIEILDASQRFPVKSLFTVQFDDKLLRQVI